MLPIRKTLAALGTVMALSLPVHAQGLVTEKNISLAMAQAGIDKVADQLK